jgi:hypothetical protein
MRSTLIRPHMSICTLIPTARPGIAQEQRRIPHSHRICERGWACLPPLTARYVSVCLSVLCVSSPLTPSLLTHLAEAPLKTISQVRLLFLFFHIFNGPGMQSDVGGRQFVPCCANVRRPSSLCAAAAAALRPPVHHTYSGVWVYLVA